MRNWRKQNPERARAYRRTYYERNYQSEGSEYVRNFARRYGLTVDVAQGIIASKPEACEVCGRNDVAVCYDHDHATMDHRGWLCGGCNAAIGQAQDDPAILRKLADYLDAHTPLLG